jgi:hypothetical protein
MKASQAGSRGLQEARLEEIDKFRSRCAVTPQHTL